MADRQEDDVESDSNDDVDGVVPPSREEIARLLDNSPLPVSVRGADQAADEMSTTKKVLSSPVQATVASRHASCPDLSKAMKDGPILATPLSPYARYIMHLDPEKDEAWTLLQQLNKQCIEDGGTTVLDIENISKIMDGFQKALDQKADVLTPEQLKVENTMREKFETNATIFDTDIQNFLLENYSSLQVQGGSYLQRGKQLAGGMSASAQNALNRAKIFEQGKKLFNLGRRKSKLVEKIVVAAERRKTLGRLFPAQLQQTQQQELHSLLQSVNNWGCDVFKLAQLAPDDCLVLMGHATLATQNLISDFTLEPRNLRAFLTKAQQMYIPDVPYHNAMHAADITQTFHYFMNKGGLGGLISPLRRLAGIIAAVVHDIQHPGVSNLFLCNTAHDTAVRYAYRSPLESMHCATALALLKRYNFLEHLPKVDQKDVRETIVDIILATDNATHALHMGELDGKLENKILDMEQSCDQLLVMRIGLHAADVSNPAKPWLLCRKWTDRVIEEFYAQGDRERELGLPISFGCDKMNPMPLDKFQAGFIVGVVKPLYSLFDRIAGVDMKEPLDTIDDNLSRWKNYIETGNSPTNASASAASSQEEKDGEASAENAGKE